MTTLAIIEILVRIAWLAGAVAFVLGLARMNSPATARNGNLLSAGGMTLAIVATAVLILSRELLGPESDGISVIGWTIILLGIALGGGARAVHRRGREDDRDAPAGVAVQRGRRRRGGAHRHRGLPAPGRPRRRHPPRHATSSSSSTSSSARSPSPARSSPSGKLQGLDPGQAHPHPGRPARDRRRWPRITVVVALFLFATGTPNLAPDAASSWPRR